MAERSDKDARTRNIVVKFLDKSQITTHNKLVVIQFLFFSYLLIHWFKDVLGSRVGIAIVNPSLIDCE